MRFLNMKIQKLLKIGKRISDINKVRNIIMNLISIRRNLVKIINSAKIIFTSIALILILLVLVNIDISYLINKG